MNSHNTVSLSQEEILQILPHRPPFLLIDQITEWKTGKWGVGTRYVTNNEPFGPGIPPLLLVEMMAQVGAVVILGNRVQDSDARERFSLTEDGVVLPYLTRIEAARFGPPIMPGDLLTATVTLIKARRSLGWAGGNVMVGETLVCEAIFTYALIGANFR